MRIFSIVLLSLSLLAIAGPGFAQATNPYDVSWSALDPGNDWAAQVLRSIFPVPGGTPGTSTGNEATVIGQIVGQFTGFVAAIAAAFVSYITIINIHRAAETSRILGTGQSWMFVVRVGFAGIMMFPLGGGFSAGQALVLQAAMAGVGMAKAVYANAIQAIGPDAVTIAQPMIPGTKQIVSGLIDSELCMDLVNLAANTTLIPAPQPITASNGNGGYTTWRYSLSTGNEYGNPVCGTVTVREKPQNEQTVAGVSVDMATVQKAILSDVLTGSIRSQVASVAQNLWQTNRPRPSSRCRASSTTPSIPTPASSQRRHQHPERHQQRPPKPTPAGTQRQSGSPAERGAAIDARVDRRRRLLPRNRQAQCDHAVAAQCDARHHLADL